jgi:predicted MPP superfamily phosphohydrolase
MPLDLRPEPMTEDVLAQLEQRLGRLHARQRLGIETDNEARVFGHGLNFFHPENWYSVHSVLRLGLRMAGLYRRGRRNAEDVQVRRNRMAFPHLPPAFEGLTILHMTDMHVEMSRGAMDRLIEILPRLDYDACVLTGDFRAKTFGPIEATLEGIDHVCRHLRGPVYGVLGNHDTIRMVPGMEAMGVRMLLNEAVEMTRGNQRIHLAGIDDAHYYRVDNIQKTAERIPHGEFAILLSHTPEIYRQAAHAGFSLLLGGHTHGGQICLPGAIPITLDSVLPRRMGAGAWRYNQMIGYTSVGLGSCIVPVRLNCLPEVVLHRLERAEGPAAG